MRAKDAEWLNGVESMQFETRGHVFVGTVEIKLDEIEQEFAALKAENENNKEYIAYLQSIIDGMSEKPTDR